MVNSDSRVLSDSYWLGKDYKRECRRLYPYLTYHNAGLCEQLGLVLRSTGLSTASESPRMASVEPKTCEIFTL